MEGIEESVGDTSKNQYTLHTSSPLVREIVPKKLVSMIFLSTDKSVSRADPRELIPALFTRMSTRPNACRASCALSRREEGKERSRVRVFGECSRGWVGCGFACVWEGGNAC